MEYARDVNDKNLKLSKNPSESSFGLILKFNVLKAKNT